MVETVLGALAPIVVTLLLGFVAAWRDDFEPAEATVLNRMVMFYAVPIALFVGTIGTTRAELVKDVAFAVAIFVAIVGLYGLVFLLFRFVLRFATLVVLQLSSKSPLDPLLAERLLLALAELGVPTAARPKMFQRAMGVILVRRPVRAGGRRELKDNARTQACLKIVGFNPMRDRRFRDA